jgi:hypothetical protein
MTRHKRGGEKWNEKDRVGEIDVAVMMVTSTLTIHMSDRFHLPAGAGARIEQTTVSRGRKYKVERKSEDADDKIQ